MLAKLARNIDRDREDVVALARGLGSMSKFSKSDTGRSFDQSSEGPIETILTLRLWVEMIEEIQSSGPRA